MKFDEEVSFMGQHRLNAALEEQPHAFAQSRDPEDVRSTTLEAVGKFDRLHGKGRIASSPTLTPGGDLDSFSHHEAAGAGRAEKGFVACEGQEIDGVSLDINRHYAGGLRSVDQQEGAALAHDRTNSADRLDRARDVRGMR
jgi:hypothetical protein